MSSTEKHHLEHYLEIFRILGRESEINQRKLAQKLNMSLGKLNYCLNALIKKGWVKAANFKNSKRKLAYAYILTPAGIEEKARLTLTFLRQKTKEYEELGQTINVLRQELDVKQKGEGESSEIVNS